MWQRRIDEPTPGHVRVLVENASPALRFSDFRRYRDAGLDVTLCGGPEHERDACPLTTGGRCPHVEEADVVLFGFGVPSPILDAVRAHHPAATVVVEVARDARPRLPEGCIPLPFPCSVDEQVRVLVGAAWPS